MAVTVKDLDARIEAKRREIAQMEDRRRKLVAKNREQERKWCAAVCAEAGRRVVEATGCDWSRLDLEALSQFLAEHAEEASALLVTPERTPAEAHEALLALTRPPRPQQEAQPEGQQQ